MTRPERKREHLSYEENVCHTYACAIQQCLKRNNYDEKKCKKAIDQWRQCLKLVNPPDSLQSSSPSSSKKA